MMEYVSISEKLKKIDIEIDEKILIATFFDVFAHQFFAFASRECQRCDQEQTRRSGEKLFDHDDAPCG